MLNFVHLSNVCSPCCAAVVKEVDEPLKIDMLEPNLHDDLMQGNLCATQGYFTIRYEIVDVPISLLFQKPPVDKPNPK